MDPAPEAPPAGPARRESAIARRTMSLLESSQDLVTFAAGGALVVLAGGLLAAAVVDFFTQAGHDVGAASTSFLDRALLVLILVEVVHTVVLSLRTHTLLPEPFVVVGLIAVIRKILLVLAGTGKADSTQLAFLVAMLATFLAGLVVLRILRGRSSNDPDSGL